MPVNPANGAEVPLSLFGSLDTELNPADVPEGVSPDNQDVIYVPGSVASRPCLRRVFTAAISGTPALTFLQTVTLPDGGALNLYLDSLGTLWKEDPIGDPGVLSSLLSVTVGSIGKGCSAFDRAWVAFSDGVSGTDAPRQYSPNGNLDRVTQDGPGAPPTSVADYTSSATITTVSLNGATIAASTGIAIAVDPGGLTATATITTTAAHGLLVGQPVAIGGAARSLVLGQFTILTVPSTTTFTISIVVAPITITAINRVSNVEEVASGVPHNLIVGDTVLVTGTADTSLSGSFAVTVVPTSVQWKCANTGSDTSPAPGVGAQFIPTAFATSGGGYVAASATASFSALPGNANVGDPMQINGSVALDSTYPFDNATAGNPQYWTILKISGSDITFSLLGWAPTSGDLSTSGGTASVGGLSSAGQYQCVQYFLTRNGAFTAPSPPIYFESNGNAKFQVTGLAIGPSNVLARVLAFTGSGGANFFTIPATVTLPNQIPGGDQITIAATIVPDNSTTTAIFDVSDNALFGALGIDIPGNNLFNQVVLTPCLGFFAYNQRLFAWGEWNKIENLLNMGFDGGYITTNTPTGWTVATTGGALVSSGVDYGFGWQITGDGTSGKSGEITQPAATDYNGVAILDPSTQYSVRAWIAASGTSGSVICELYSATSGSLATGTIALSGVSTTGKFYEAKLSAVTPATIPSDTVLRIYATSQSSGQTVTIDEVVLIYTDQPYNLTPRASYAANPEGFDGVTGNIGPGADPTQVQGMGVVRTSLVMITQRGPYIAGNGQTGEPSTWELAPVSKVVGALSINSLDAGFDGTGDSGEEWLVIASRGGLYIYEGGELPKISQEIQPTWERINWDAQGTIWVKNDSYARRIYVGVPLDAATEPSHILVLDRRELETAQQIAASPPMRISFTGKMIASDLSRKWTIWNLGARSAAIMTGSAGQSRLVLGGKAYGQAYTLGPQFSTDDDYGQVYPYYTTFFFVNHEAEQMFGVGSQRKLYKQVTISASGAGTLAVTPLADNLANAWPSTPAYTLASESNQDQALGMNVSADRCAFKVFSSPSSGTDNGFNFAKIVVLMTAHPVAQTSGSVV